MKKINKGFILLETMVVSAFVISTLIFLYIQFVNLKNSYNNSFKYNTIPGLYAAKNVQNYINGHNYSYMKKDASNSEVGYIELYNKKTCNLTYFQTEEEYCKKLMSELNIKTLLMTKESLDGLKNDLKEKDKYSNGLYMFTKKISNQNNANYRLIVEFNDDTFANLEIK